MSLARLIVGALLAAALCIAGPCRAHKESDAYLTLSAPEDARDATRFSARFDVALRDLHALLDLDQNRDERLTWAEVRAKHADIETLLRDELRFSTTAGDCPIGAVRHAIDRHSDGGYAVMQFEAQCPGAVSALHLAYRLFDGIDSSHRLILRTPDAVRALGADAAPVAIGWTDPAHATGQGAATHSGVAFAEFVASGFKHILIGWDHLAFLLLLIIPLAWQDPPQRGAWRRVLMIVTAFTVAHSITLGLTVAGVLSPPARLVEAVIAASIVVAAVMNLLRVRPRLLAGLALGFGLIHGFGFALALRDAGLGGQTLWQTLFGFNAGVEFGQLAIVGVVWPVAVRLRGVLTVRRFGVSAISLLLAGAGAVALIERALGIVLF